MGLPIEWFKKNTFGVWYDSEVHLVILILGEVEDEGIKLSFLPNPTRPAVVIYTLPFSTTANHCVTSENNRQASQ